jgi:hypothetical protein
MADEAIHMILGWRCDTQDCGMFHFAKYLGEKDKLPPDGVMMKLRAAGRTFLILCPRCQKRHEYHPKDLRYMEVTGPRPAELQDLM